MRHPSEAELIEYLDGELAAARVKRVDRHLAVCARCRQALAGLREAAAAARSLSSVAPPPDLRARVAAKLEENRLPDLTCREVGRLLHEYVDGALSPAMVQQVQRHVQVCLRCRAELVLLFKVVSAVRSLRSLTPPAVIAERVWAARRALPAGGAEAWWRRGLRPALAAGVVAVAALLVVMMRPAPRATEIATRPADTVASEPAVSSAVPASPAEEAMVTPEQEPAAPSASAESPDASLPVRRPREGRSAAVAVRPGLRAEPVVSRPEETRTPVPPRSLPLPSAVLTLREIADSAGAESDAHEGMAAASEQFATLAWEASLSAPPSGERTLDSPAGDGENPGTSEGETPEEMSPGSRTGNNRAEGITVPRPLA